MGAVAYGKHLTIDRPQPKNRTFTYDPNRSEQAPESRHSIPTLNLALDPGTSTISFVYYSLLTMIKLDKCIKMRVQFFL